MKANLREIIHYIDESTLEKAKNEKVQKQESPSKMSKDVRKAIIALISAVWLCILTVRIG